MARYEVRVYDTAFRRRQVINDWFELHLVEALNEMDELSLVIDSSRLGQVADLSVLDAIIEVWQWFPPNQSKRIQSTLLHRFPQDSIPTDTKSRYVSHSVGLEHLLDRRIIGYKQGDSNASVNSLPVETAMKFFVNLNAGPGAGARAVPNFVIEPDSGYGPVWTGQRGLQALYATIQEISKSGQILPDGSTTTVDFGVEWDKSNNTFVFKVYKPFRGIDRHDKVELSVPFNTAYNLNYEYDRRKEINSVWVLGQGSEAARTIQVVNDTDLINESPWNMCESTADDTTDSTTDALTSFGKSKITTFSQLEKFTFDVLDDAQNTYGRDYFLGDIVRVRVNDKVRAKRITSVQTDVVEGKETKRITCTDFPSLRTLNQIFRTLASRTAKLETRGHL